jgi:enamine deaminase RidA (YjgF/YER057c/UK114 family)
MDATADTAFITLRPDAQRASVASDVRLIDGWAYVSGVAPIDLNDDNVPIPELVEDQTRKIFANLTTLLQAVGLGLEDVVSVRLYVVDLKRFQQRVDKVYRRFFDPGRMPARTSLGVAGLTRGALVEMDVVAKRAANG